MWSAVAIMLAFGVLVGLLAGVGAALASTGYGLAGMALIALIIAAIGLACIGAGAGIAMMVNSITNLIDGFARLMEATNTYGQQFIDTIGAIFNKFLDVIISTAPKIKDAAVVVIKAIAQGLIEAAPYVSEALTVLLIYLMENVRDSTNKAIPILADTLSTALIVLLNTLADEIREKTPIILKAIKNLLEAVLESVLVGLAAIVEPFGGIGKKIAKKLTSWIPSLRKAFEVIDEESDSALDEVIDMNKELDKSTSETGGLLDKLSGLLNGNGDSGGGLSSLLGNIDLGSFMSNQMTSATDAVKKESPEMQAALKDAFDTGVLDDVESKFNYVSRSAAEAAVEANSNKYAIRRLDDGTEQFITRIKNAKGEYEYFAKAIYDSESPVNSIMNMLSGSSLNLDGLTKSFGGTISTAGETSQNMTQTIKEPIDNLVSSAETSGSDMVSNFNSGVRSKFDDARSTSNELAEIVGGPIKFSEPDVGPLSNFHTFAPDMIDLWCKGIKDKLGSVDNSSDSMVNRIKEGFTKALDYVSSLIDGGMSDELTIRPIMDLSEIQNGTKLLDSMLANRNGYPIYGTANLTSSAAYGMRTLNSNKEFVPAQQVSETHNNYNTFNITNNDPDVVAQKVSKIMQRQVTRKQAVYAAH